MLDAVRVALENDRSRIEQDKKTTELRKLYDSLKSREQEVMGFVTAGLSSAPREAVASPRVRRVGPTSPSTARLTIRVP
jgi:hypothetical protein